jgi:leucyl aminopeptidase
MPKLFAAPAKDAVPVWFVTKETWPALRDKLPKRAAAFAAACGFEPNVGQHCLLPDTDGSLASVLFGVAGEDARWRDPMLVGKLVALLPEGAYRFANEPPGDASALELATLGWLLSAYRFNRYKPASKKMPRLVAPEGLDATHLERITDAITLARDLVNTPTNDMGPEALEEAALALAKRYKAKANVIRGDKLLDQNFPLIHAVGRAGAEAPRLVDFVWGPAKGPKVTLVGKGVCFDTGGLDIKPSSAMLLMKKDMAGAATALALAQMIMAADLPVRLRVLLPIVENAIAGNAFRPGDIYPSRKGHTVEIGNTDAEGRLVLADALALGDADSPDLMFVFATLTGAARVALGPDLPPFYTMDEALAQEIAQHGTAVADPVWRLPLWEPYDSLIDGKISTINNVSQGPFAGSITAALFLRRFIDKAKAWAHFDIYGWNPSTKPGRPEGGETQTARLLFDLIEARCGAKPG